jgi:transcriptional regulator with XRE-family HTH domain
MEQTNLRNIGAAMRRARGDAGLRETAREIGISPATLSRVEGGKLPDIETFKKLCTWMRLDAGIVLGTKGTEPTATAVPLVHLKTDKNLSDNAIKALSAMILATNAMFTE